MYDALKRPLRESHTNLQIQSLSRFYYAKGLFESGGPWGIRIPNLEGRSFLLYPIELTVLLSVVLHAGIDPATRPL